MPYVSPDRQTWHTYLNGASFTDMTEMSRTAKKPVFLGAGGITVSDAIEKTSYEMEYGDKTQNDNFIARKYMSDLEYELYDLYKNAEIEFQNMLNKHNEYRVTAEGLKNRIMNTIYQCSADIKNLEASSQPMDSKSIKDLINEIESERGTQKKIYNNKYYY